MVCLKDSDPFRKGFMLLKVLNFSIQGIGSFSKKIDKIPKKYYVDDKFPLEKILIPFMSGIINHDLTSCPDTVDLRT